MTFVVGFPPHGRGRAVLDLAGMLARSGDEDLLIAAVVPAPWLPGPARVDAEYQAELDQLAQTALDDARSHLPGDVHARFVVHHARSTTAGLLEVAARNDAAMIVVGSPSSGALGQVTLGSVSDGLVHSSPIPVALAPRGFRCRSACSLKRATAAYGGADDELIAAVAEVAVRVGAQLRVVSFAVRPRPPVQAGVGRLGEDAIVAQWVRDIAEAIPEGVPAVIGRGETWAEALEDVEWAEGDVLVVGSSSLGPVARVFLGSRASKIARASPVPVVVVPRAALGA